MEIEVIYGQIIGKANHYTVGCAGGTRHIMKDTAIRAYERNFLKQCKLYKNRMIDCQFTLHVQCFMESARFDLDNSLKTLLDCLQYARAITNDNLCRAIRAEKYVDRQHPRVVFRIVPDEPNLFQQNSCPLAQF